MKTTQFTKKTDFKGEVIYVGLDIHKKQWSVTIRTSLVEHKSFVQPPCAKTLGDYLRKHFPNAEYRSAYEAGFCGFSVHYALIEEGIENIVINASDIPTTDKEKKSKRDKVDSRKICKNLVMGLLTGIYVPSKAESEEKEAVRLRKKMVSDITRCKNRITSFLDRRGVHLPEDISSATSWSRKHISWLESLELDTSVGTASLRIMVRELTELIKLKKELERSILEDLKQKYGEEYRLLKKIPGLGSVASVTVLTELGTTERFSNVDSLASYVGLVPNVYGSGEREYIGNMTKRKNSYVQSILIQCAWMSLRRDPSMTKRYHELSHRMKPNKAIIRIARKLLTRIRYVLINKEEYMLSV
jgi:transposase